MDKAADKMLRRDMAREGEDRRVNEKGEKKKEGKRAGRTGGKKLKKTPNVPVMLKRKEKGSVSKTGKKGTEDVNRAPVKGAPRVDARQEVTLGTLAPDHSPL